MAMQVYQFKVPESMGRVRLDQGLFDWLNSQDKEAGLSKGKIRKLIIAGAVYLNGKRVRIASKGLIPGAKVKAYIDLRRLEKSTPVTQFDFTSDLIEFEDKDLLVVFKPAGLPTHATVDDARANLYTSLKKFIAKRDGAQDPYLGIHHRLDRDTAGLLLFTKTKRVNKAIGDGFADHSIRKTYLAWVEGDLSQLQDKWKVQNFLGLVGKRGKTKKHGSVQAGGKVAETHFEKVKIEGKKALIKAMPVTGRTHQIRVHCSESGLPIIGDRLYGKRLQENQPSMQLFASELSFKHPLSNEDMTLRSSKVKSFLENTSLAQS